MLTEEQVRELRWSSDEEDTVAERVAKYAVILTAKAVLEEPYEDIRHEIEKIIYYERKRHNRLRNQIWRWLFRSDE